MSQFLRDSLPTPVAVHLAVACDVFLYVSLCCPFFPRDVLDRIWDLIGSVSEGFPTYYCMFYIQDRDSFEHCLRKNDAVPAEERQKLKEDFQPT